MNAVSFGLVSVAVLLGVARPIHHHVALAVAGEGMQVRESGSVEFHC